MNELAWIVVPLILGSLFLGYWGIKKYQHKLVEKEENLRARKINAKRKFDEDKRQEDYSRRLLQREKEREVDDNREFDRISNSLYERVSLLERPSQPPAMTPSSPPPSARKMATSPTIVATAESDAIAAIIAAVLEEKSRSSK